MEMVVKGYNTSNKEEATEIWNEVVLEKNAFPQDNVMTVQEANSFFKHQSYTAVAYVDNKVVGLYILHPNNVGRCGHIANASYAVKKEMRGNHIGRALVKHSIDMAYKIGFKVLQFNAVVATNMSARHLYESLGFIPLGTIKNGFRNDDGSCIDICPYYIELKGE